MRTTSVHIIVLSLLIVPLGLTTGSVAQTDSDDGCLEAPPLDVGLVIDRSGSMGGSAIEAAKEGSRRLVENLTARDQSGLVSYAGTARLDQPLATDHATTISEIESLIASGTTATGDGIDLSHSDFVNNGRPEARPIMIVLTDGFTNAGLDPVTQATEAKADGIEIFAIGLGTSVNEAELQQIASEPVEDHYFRPLTEGELVEVFEQIAGEVSRSSTVAEAYALRADAQLAHDPRLVVPKVAQATFPAGADVDVHNVSTSVAGLSVRLDVARDQANAATGPGTASAWADARITGVRVVEEATDRLVLAADVLSAAAQVEATATSTAHDTSGSVLVGLYVDGVGTIEHAPPPNTVLDLAGLGTLVLNEQVISSGTAWSSVTVNMVHLTLDGADGNATGEIVIASAHAAASCAQDTSFPNPRPESGEPRVEGGPDATLPGDPGAVGSGVGFWALHDPLELLPGETDTVDQGVPGVLHVSRSRAEWESPPYSSSSELTTVEVIPADVTVALEWYAFGYDSESSSSYYRYGSGWGELTVCIQGTCESVYMSPYDREWASSGSTWAYSGEDRQLWIATDDAGASFSRYRSSYESTLSNSMSDCFYGDVWLPYGTSTDTYHGVCRFQGGGQGFEYTDLGGFHWASTPIGSLYASGDVYTQTYGGTHHAGEYRCLFGDQQDPAGLGFAAFVSGCRYLDASQGGLAGYDDQYAWVGLPGGWVELDRDTDLYTGVSTLTVTVYTAQTGEVSQTLVLPP